MSYFTDFQRELYEFDVDGILEPTQVVNILTNVRIRSQMLKSITAFDEYDIEDGEKLDHIAAKLYGDARLHWVIMLVNDRYDYVNDFPLSERELEDYVREKYGESAVNEQHLLFGVPVFIDSSGNITSEQSEFTSPVTNFEYERIMNEGKRRIRVPKSNNVRSVVSELVRLINAPSR